MLPLTHTGLLHLGSADVWGLINSSFRSTPGLNPSGVSSTPHTPTHPLVIAKQANETLAWRQHHPVGRAAGLTWRALGPGFYPSGSLRLSEDELISGGCLSTMVIITKSTSGT